MTFGECKNVSQKTDRLNPANDDDRVSRSNGATYTGLVGGIRELLDAARRSSARAVNVLMTATYWEMIGHRIVEFEQGGKKRASYGEELLKRLSVDLTTQFGRGFSRQNLQTMRLFFWQRPHNRFARHCLANPLGIKFVQHRRSD